MILKALILAAGLGTRLRPITLETPKCLVEIDGEPLLALWLEKLQHLGCDSALINTHYLSQKVENFSLQWKKKSVMKVETVYEPELLGTAGTLRANKKFFDGSTGFLVHADNATNADLFELLMTHEKRAKNCLLTMLTFETSNPTECGIVETDAFGVVTGFHEKVKEPPCNVANGAVYIFDKPFLDWLDTLDVCITDFSTEIIPKLIGRIQTFHTKDPFFDIGTPKSLCAARKIIHSYKAY